MGTHSAGTLPSRRPMLKNQEAFLLPGEGDASGLNGALRLLMRLRFFIVGGNRDFRLQVTSYWFGRQISHAVYRPLTC